MKINASSRISHFVYFYLKMSNSPNSCRSLVHYCIGCGRSSQFWIKINTMFLVYIFIIKFLARSNILNHFFHHWRNNLLWVRLDYWTIWIRIWNTRFIRISTLLKHDWKKILKRFLFYIHNFYFILLQKKNSF